MEGVLIMAVSEQKILTKMLAEVQKAKEEQDAEKRKQHIGHVQLLCELLLEEETALRMQSDMPNNPIQPVQQQDNAKSSRSGDSIFDF